MDSIERDVEDLLRRRYWLKDNFEWFMEQVTYHKEFSAYFNNKRLKVWHFGDQEGKVKVVDEASFGPQ